MAAFPGRRGKTTGSFTIPRSISARSSASSIRFWSAGAPSTKWPAGRTSIPGMETIVFSKTLEQGEYPGVTVVGKDHKKAIDALRKQKGKDIWLFGGGSLFQSLLADKLVDTVEVSVMPVLLGGGTLLLPSPAPRTPLKLENYKVYKNGTVSLVYSIKRP